MKSGNLEPDALQAEVDVLNRLQADTAPGLLKNYPDAKKLVTEDCIKPA